MRNEVDGASSLWSSNHLCDRSGLSRDMNYSIDIQQVILLGQNPPSPGSQSKLSILTDVGALLGVTLTQKELRHSSLRVSILILRR